MKAIIWKKKNVIELGEVSKPTTKKDEALIKVIMIGICGSDLTILSGKHPRAIPPLILGHEFIGIIEAIQCESSDLKIGDRVVVEPLLSCGVCKYCLEGNGHVCNKLKLMGIEASGAFTEYISVPVKNVYKLPDNITNQSAVLIEPLSVAVHTLKSSNLSKNSDSDVVIIGAGPIGLLCAHVAKAMGARSIFIVEINEDRIKFAQSNGFNTINALEQDPTEVIQDITNGKGAEITIDASGSKHVGKMIIPITSIKGKIMMVAIHKEPCEVNFQQLSYKEQEIIGIRIYAEGDFKESIRLLSKEEIKIDNLVTRIFPFSDFHKAFDEAKNNLSNCKVVIAVEEDL